MKGIELEDVTRAYGAEAALSSLSVTLEAGRGTAVIGRSGSGKSTLLRLVAGLEPPTSGAVAIDGRTVSAAGRIVVPPHERGLSMVFQDLALWPNLSVLDNVLLGLHGLRLTARDARARALEVLELCGIASLRGRRPGEVSGGEQQRAALARAIAARPRYLLLDEPFSGLDLVTKHRLLEETAALSRRSDTTVLLVTHDPYEALALCSWGVVLEAGRIEDAGELDELVRASGAEILRLFRSARGAAGERGVGADPDQSSRCR